MKIGFISRFNPIDRRASSGTTFQMWQALKMRGYEMEWIEIREGLLYRIIRCMLSIFSRITNTKTKIEYTKIGAFLEANSISRTKIRNNDLLIGAFCSGAISCLKTDSPIIYFSDATFNLLDGYYFCNLSKISIDAGNIIEKRALDNATSIVVSSNWARDSVVNDYDINESKVDVIEFGANIDDENIKIDNIVRTPANKKPLQLIFIGVDWVRKGGEIAVNTLDWLNSNGINSELHVIGIKDLPKAHSQNKKVINHGFLNKNIPSEYSLLTEILTGGDLLIFPTIRECAGIVFCEASAYGLPIFSHNTGGTSNYVIEGVNGHLLELGSSGEDFGNKIKDCIDDGSLFSMKRTARMLYKSNLNWNTWSEKVSEIVEKLFQ